MAVNRFTTKIGLLLGFQFLLAHPALSDTDKFFESGESTFLDNIDNKTNNRDGDNPVITIKRFDISNLKEMPEYGILVEEIDQIVKEDRKENNNRYNIDRLNSLAQKLTTYYRQNGLILAKVYFPPQQRVNYTLKFDVVLGEIEDVQSDNNEYYSDIRLHRPFQDLVNKPAYVPTLESSLLEINEYPGLELATRFTEGKQIGRTQIEVMVKEEKATDFAFSFDNYGSDYTGLYRGTFKADFYNVADQADRLNLNLLAAINPMNSLYGGLSYRFKVAPYFQDSSFGNAFFRHGLNVQLGYQQSQFTVGGEFEELDIKGEATTTSIGVDKDLILRNHHRLNTGLSLNMKVAKTTSQGELTKEDRLSILNWSTYYKWNDALGGGGANLVSLEVHHGLEGFAGSMKQDDPNTSRLGALSSELSGSTNCTTSNVICAPVEFTKYNLTLSRNQKMGLYWLLFRLRHQETDEIMMASEQINLGGPTSVRGYAASDFSADKASILTLEYSGISNARKYSIPISHLKLAGFIDHGYGERLNPFANELSKAHMTSIGGYAQFIKKKTFSTKLEIAIPLSEVEGSSTQDFEILFNMERGF